MKKLFCLLLALLMTVTVFTACNNEEQPGGDSATPTEGATESTPAETDPPAPQTLTLVKDGVAQYYVLCEDAQFGETVEYLVDDIRKKTGVTLEAFTAPLTDTELGVIYIGSDYNKVLPDAEDKMTHKGYGVAYADGALHVCGNQADTVRSAAKKFLSSIPTKECVTKNEEGKSTLTIPLTLMFLFNPTYSVKDPTLLSKHISDYRLVYAENSSYTDQLLVQQLADAIGKQTGYTLPLLTDNMAAAENEIIFGATARGAVETLDAESYTITAKDSDIYINYSSAEAAIAAIEALKEVYGKTEVNVSGKVDESLKIIKDATDIRIMTSNVLFTNAENAELPYKERAALLSKVYLDYKPDFIGLQEAAGNIGDQIKKNIQSEYTMITQSNNRHTPIFYRTDTWQVVTENGAEVKKMEMFGGNHCWEYEWVMFEHKTTGQRVIVMNLHFQPRGYNGQMRPAAMDLWNAEVKRLEAAYPNIPILSTGDYNTTVKMGRNTTENWDDGWNEDIIVGTNLQCGAQLTTNTQDPNGTTIDHICVSKDLVEVQRHRIVKYDAMEKSSDHKPIFIDIQIKSAS